MGLFGLFKAKWQHSDPDIRLAAVESLKDKQQKVFQQMAAQDEDPRVRQAAIGRLQDPFQLAQLSKEDPDPATRLRAVAQLEDEDLLRRLLEDAEDPQVVVAVAEKLGDLAPILEQVRRTADTALFANVLDRLEASALVDMAHQAPSEGIARMAIEALQREEDLETLASGEGSTAVLAAENLAQWQALKAHLAALENEEQAQRLEAVKTLGASGSRRAVGPLVALAGQQTEPTALRLESLIALGSLGGHEAVPPLIDILKNTQESEEIRATAVESLGRIGDLRAVEAIGTALHSAGNFISLLRRNAVKALGELPENRSAEILVHALRNDDVVVQGGAVASLVKLGDLAFDPLLRALQIEGVEGFVRQAQLESLEKITGQKLGSDVEKWRQWRRDNA